VNLLDFIPQIPTDQQYWFVRTNSGDYYDDFVNEGFIGIGWNKITFEDFNINRPLGDVVKERYPDTIKYNHVAKQIDTFSRGIKKGDIVLIPSTKSTFIHFGIVQDNEAYEEEEIPVELEDIDNHPELEFNFEGVCPYKKRRRVNWIDVKKRDKLDPQLYRLIYSQQTITDAKPYSVFIERALYDFFIKGDKCHMVLHVERKGDIKGNHLVPFMADILNIANSNLEENEDGVDLKVRVQSEGTIELIGLIPTIIFASVAIVGILGGRAKFLGMEIDTPGIMGRILEWKGKNQEINRQNQQVQQPQQASGATGIPEAQQERLKSNAENLAIKLPENLEKSLKEYVIELNQGNNDESSS
jgi:restriction system protein